MIFFNRGMLLLGSKHFLIYLFVFYLLLPNYLYFRPILRPTDRPSSLHLETASGVEGQVTGLKIEGPLAFTPSLLAITRQQVPLQVPDFKKLDDPEG